MYGGEFPLLLNRVDPVQNNTDCHRAHNFHGLTHRGQRGRVQTGSDDIVETDDRAVLRNP